MSRQVFFWWHYYNFCQTFVFLSVAAGSNTQTERHFFFSRVAEGKDREVGTLGHCSCRPPTSTALKVQTHTRHAKPVWFTSWCRKVPQPISQFSLFNLITFNLFFFYSFLLFSWGRRGSIKYPLNRLQPHLKRSSVGFHIICCVCVHLVMLQNSTAMRSVMHHSSGNMRPYFSS